MFDHLKKSHKMDDTKIAGSNKYADKLKKVVSTQTKMKDHFLSIDSDSSNATVYSQGESQEQVPLRRKRNLKAAKAFVDFAPSEMIPLASIMLNSTINFIKNLGGLCSNTDISYDTITEEFKSKVAVIRSNIEKSLKKSKYVSLATTSYVTHTYEKISMLRLHIIDENWKHETFFLSYNCQLEDKNVKFPTDWFRQNLNLFDLESKTIQFTSNNHGNYAKRNITNNKCFGHLIATLLHEKSFQKQLKSIYQKVLDCITNIYMLEQTLLEKEKKSLENLILMSSEKCKKKII